MPELIDIARKPVTFVRCDERHEVFAPSWDLLMAYKGRFIPWEEYVRRYTEEMRAAYKADPTPFIEMAKRLDDVTFVCWCERRRRKDDRCHRFLLRGILERVREQRTTASPK